MTTAGHEPRLRSPAHGIHEALGARFGEIGAWEVPLDYPGRPEDGWRHAVGVVDVSALAKAELRGRDAPTLARGVTAARSVIPAGDESALCVGAPGEEGRILEAIPEGTEALEATHLYAGFLLIGARLGELLPRLAAFDLARLGEGEGVATTVLEVRGLVGRGAAGLELYVGSEHGRYAAETLISLAEELGGGPVGWRIAREEGWV